MIHVDALPGTPGSTISPSQIIDKACREAEIYDTAGIDAIMIENMHDRPYLNREVGPEIVAVMSAIASQLRSLTNKPCGIQILAGADKESIAVAHASSMAFVRCEGFLYGHLADEGYMESDAGELLRYRRQIGAEDVLVFTDIKKKHGSHVITQDISIGEMARSAAFFRSDGVVVTGSFTGVAPDLDELRQLTGESQIPVLIGSGITADNLPGYYPYADGFIVGSWLKQNGNWELPPDQERIEQLLTIKTKLDQVI